MNCQELHATLDSRSQESLTVEQRREIETHFGSCRTCAEAWAVYREFVAEPIPHAAPELRQRIAEAVDATAAEKVRGLRRSILLGSVLVVGAAVAKTLSLDPQRNEQLCTRV